MGGVLPVFLEYESVKTRHCMASDVMFSRELIELDLDLENELSNLSTRPINITFRLVTEICLLLIGCKLTFSTTHALADIQKNN